MKPIILISVLTYAVLSAYAFAECDQETVEQQLRAADIEYDVTAPLVWEFPTPTHLLQLQIDRNDGDMTWRALISDRGDLSFRQVHEVQQDFKYVQLDYVNINGRKLLAVFSMPHWGHGCSTTIVQNTAMFYSLVVDISEKFPKFVTQDTPSAIVTI